MAISNFYRGDTVTFDIVIKDDDGNPIDISGSTIIFTMKNNMDDADPGILQKIQTTHTNPTLGQSQIILSHTDTKALVPGSFFYDFQLTLDNGDVQTIDLNKVSVMADVTNE